MRRGGVLLTVWLVVAGLAITVGTWALSLVGGEISDQAIAPLSDSQIAQSLRADRAGDGGVVGNVVTPTPSTLDVSRPGLPKPFNTVGGHITAWCDQGKVTVVGFPAQGYRYKDDSGQGYQLIHSLSLKPERADLPKIEVRVWCDKNVPQFDQETDGHHDGPTSGSPTPSVTDDHGGSSGGHGADDGADDSGTDDHNRRGAGSGGGGSSGGGSDD